MGTSFRSAQSQPVVSTQPSLDSNTTEIVTPHTAPYFLPAPSNILAIESCFSMGGPRLILALLYSPRVASGGIAVDSSGRIRSVPRDQWEEMESLVQQAKDVSEQLHQSGWSRPQIGSCPVSMYFDLGPSETDDGLCRLHRTAQMVSTEDLLLNGRSVPLPIMKRPGILAWTKLADGTLEQTTLQKMPEPITALERALSKLDDELFPRSSEDSSSPPEVDAESKAILEAIEGLCGAIKADEGIRLAAKGFYRRSRKQERSWFNLC
ncbi:hypothetical protein DFH06DRAFT_1477073 [Mycena polygramma]|nr:hypothetical protein DFH06DRAFT_1477073 [Mycena polygramma]